MKKLHEYLGEVVKLMPISGNIVAGQVIDYTSALQNVEEYEDREMESICIQQDGYTVTFFADDIVEIEILDEAQLLFNSLLPGGSTLLYAKWPNAEKWSDADVLAWFEGSTNLVLEGGIKVPIKKVFPRCYPNEISALIESDMTEFPKHLCPVYAVAE